jgi:hypothetical protein
MELAIERRIIDSRTMQYHSIPTTEGVFTSFLL